MAVVMVHPWTASGASGASAAPWWSDVLVHASDWSRTKSCAFHLAAPVVNWWDGIAVTLGIITVHQLGRRRRHRRLHWVIMASHTDAQRPYVQVLRLSRRWWTAVINDATRGLSSPLPSVTTTAATTIKWRLRRHHSNDCSTRRKGWHLRAHRATRANYSNNSDSLRNSNNRPHNSNSSKSIRCNIRTTMPNWRAWRTVCPIWVSRDWATNHRNNNNTKRLTCWLGGLKDRRGEIPHNIIRNNSKKQVLCPAGSLWIHHLKSNSSR